MAEITDWDITEAMIVYGGGFVAGLGRLWRQADVDNQSRLRLAFADKFDAYRELALVKRERV